MAEKNQPGDKTTPCQICATKDEVLVFHQFIGLQKHTVHICQDCALILGIEKDKTRIRPQVGDLFAVVLDPDGIAEKDSKICERCGCSYGELRHNGSAGCSDCYDVFKEEIIGLLRRVNVKNRHQGRLPRRLWKMKNLFIEKPALHHKLKQALKREDYMDASRIKTEIENLEKE